MDRIKLPHRVVVIDSWIKGFPQNGARFPVHLRMPG